jgi:hypothetical protein
MKGAGRALGLHRFVAGNHVMQPHLCPSARCEARRNERVVVRANDGVNSNFDALKIESGNVAG